MLDELIAFSKISKFDIIFLRDQDEFYDEGLSYLGDNNINIYYKPFAFGNMVKKLCIVSKFLVKNIFKFRFNYNSAIGIKSIVWFLRLDLSKFSKKSKIHAQFATQAALVSMLIKEYFYGEPSYSFTFHAHDIYFKNQWFNILVNNCKRAFSISQYNIDYVRENYLDSELIELSRLGVFRDKINFRGFDSKRIDSQLTIGLISWFVEKKGISYLLEAMLVLKNKGYDRIKLSLAGDGPLKDSFLKYVKNNDLGNMVNYLGKIKGEEKQLFFNGLDAFILPSITLTNDMDGIPVVLMEAIAYSLPIISTNVSGIPEICIDKYNGYLINERDVNSIVQSIVKLCENKDELLLYSKNSLKLSNDYDIILNSKSKLYSLDWI